MFKQSQMVAQRKLRSRNLVNSQSLFLTMSEAQVDNGAAVGPAGTASEVRATGQPGSPSTPQRTTVPASPGSDPGPPQSPDSRLVELLRRENREQNAIIAEMMRRLDAQAVAIADLARPAPTCPPGYEDSAASAQKQGSGSEEPQEQPPTQVRVTDEPRTATRFIENVNSGEDASDAGAAAQSGEDAAAFYKDLWRQNKIETNKQKK